MSILALRIIHLILILEILVLFGILLHLNYKKYKNQRETQNWMKSVSDRKREGTGKEKKEDEK